MSLNYMLAYVHVNQGTKFHIYNVMIKTCFYILHIKKISVFQMSHLGGILQIMFFFNDFHNDFCIIV